MDLKLFSTDKQTEVDGVWVEMDATTKLRIARSGNEKYKKVIQAKTAPYKQAVRQGVLPDETADKILIETIAEAVLLDWVGLQEDGKDLLYNKANAVKVLTKYPEFRNFVVSASESMELYRTAAEEEAIKN